MTKVSLKIPTVVVKEIIEDCYYFTFIDDIELEENIYPKIFVNGILLGITKEPENFINELKEYRKNNLLDKSISFTFDKEENEVKIFCDEGRLLRPVFSVNEEDNRLNIKKDTKVDWKMLVEDGYIKYIDNCEVENSVIAMDQTDLKKFKCNYCEIHPAMMMGVMSNAIPFPDHSQCIFKEEPVYMADGTTKRICDIEIGDRVITFDPDTKEQTITDVIHTETHPTEKELFEITTYSNRKITATFDHRFMTSEGWKRLEHLKVDETLIAISLEPKPVSTKICEYIILDEELFKEICKKSQIKDSVIGKYANELRHIIPLKSTSNYLPVISRIFGFILTDGWVGINDNGNIRLAADFGYEYSSKLFEDDIEFLGFEKKLPRYTEKERFGNTYRVEHSGSFPALLVALGITYGKKTTQESLKIPNWILNGSKMVKREFLSGFQGGDGSKIKSNNNKQINIQIGTTSKTIETKFLDSMIEMMSDIVKLFKEFNIDVDDVKYKNSTVYKDRTIVSYYISCSRNNLIKYFDIINYRYDILKQQESGIYVEYLKYVEREYRERLELISKVKSYGKTNRQIIADNLNITLKEVYNLLKLTGKNIGLPKGLIKPIEWKAKIKAVNSMLFVPILSINKSKEYIISDITVNSKNQSFLCGDTFCVHNSPRNIYQSSMGYICLAQVVFKRYC